MIPVSILYLFLLLFVFDFIFPCFNILFFSSFRIFLSYRALFCV